MKYVIAIVAVVIMISAFVMLSPKADKNDATKALTMQTISNDIAKGALFIDVRTPEEYAAGHIKGATNMSLQTMQAGSLPTAANDTTIYVYCHSGNRSGQATAILKKAGFTNVVDLGAITHVQSIGGKIVAS